MLEARGIVLSWRMSFISVLAHLQGRLPDACFRQEERLGQLGRCGRGQREPHRLTTELVTRIHTKKETVMNRNVLLTIATLIAFSWTCKGQENAAGQDVALEIETRPLV